MESNVSPRMTNKSSQEILQSEITHKQETNDPKRSSYSDYESLIAQLENEKLELTSKLEAYQKKELVNEAKNIDTLTPSTIEITSTVASTEQGPLNQV